jgi:hypothetical protein
MIIPPLDWSGASAVLTDEQIAAAVPGRGAVLVTLRRGPVSVYATYEYADSGGGTQPTRAFTMRGAQREVTAALRAAGYEPAGRWVGQAAPFDAPSAAACTRYYRPEHTTTDREDTNE